MRVCSKEFAMKPNRLLSMMIFAGLVLMVSACAVDQKKSDEGGVTSASDSTMKYTTQTGAIKLTLDSDGVTKIPQTCTPPSDVNCNAVGPNGQRLACDPDSKCRYYKSDDSSTYPGFDEGSTVSHDETLCSDDSECTPLIQGTTNLNATCIFTQQSMTQVIGICFVAYKTCSAMAGTPCSVDGYSLCSNGNCSCSAVADLTKAGTEVCDTVDNDCDGVTDEGFNVGQACDGVDSDLCKLGTLTCTSDKLGTECVNETSQNITEVCDGVDNDCDGATDEDFPTLGVACDGNDADSCKNGKFICSTDKLGVSCNENNANVIEVCNGVDDTCEGNVDEGCDQDADGYCNPTMQTAQGAICIPSDCNDADATVHPNAVETCNNVDDNCNGVTDDGIGKGDACSDGKGVCKMTGTKVCANDGSVVCSVSADLSKQLNAEICNGLDDTCDGVTDEGCDDDKDGYCDVLITYTAGASCQPGDCNDSDVTVHPGATEVCNAVDDNCNSSTDEGCDDDADGWCDSAMSVVTTAACLKDSAGGMGHDCNDGNAAINPGVEEQCLTPGDDNCDGDTVYKKDGVTLACDSCANVQTIACNQEVTIDMAAQLNTSNAIDTYQCWSNVGPNLLKTTFSAPEVILQPNAPAGTKFSMQITSGTGVLAARLHGSCQPDTGTSGVTAFNQAAGLTGTCAAYGTMSVSGGVVGSDFIAIDAKASKTVKVKFVCAL